MSKLTRVRVSYSGADTDLNRRYARTLKSELGRLKDLRSPSVDPDPKKVLARKILGDRNYDLSKCDVIPSVYNGLALGSIPPVDDSNVLMIAAFRARIDPAYFSETSACVSYCRRDGGKLFFDNNTTIYVSYAHKKNLFDFFRYKKRATAPDLVHLVPRLDAALSQYLDRNPNWDEIAGLGKKALETERAASLDAKLAKVGKYMGGLVIAAAPIFASLGNIRLAIGVIATGLALSLWSLVSDYLSDRKINSLPKDKLVAKGNEVLDLRIEELSAKVAQAELEVRSFEEADDSSAGTVPLLKATRKS